MAFDAHKHAGLHIYVRTNNIGQARIYILFLLFSCFHFILFISFLTLVCGSVRSVCVCVAAWLIRSVKFCAPFSHTLHDFFSFSVVRFCFQQNCVQEKYRMKKKKKTVGNTCSQFVVRVTYTYVQTRTHTLDNDAYMCSLIYTCCSSSSSSSLFFFRFCS